MGSGTKHRGCDVGVASTPHRQSIRVCSDNVAEP